jgi:flagellar protein FliS
MNAHQMYRQTQANTATPGELILMLYRGAARFLASAIEAIEAKDVQRAHTNLVKAQAIVTELLQSLDADRGGEMARQLTSIYEYMNTRLVEANLHKDAEPAREVQMLLRELLPAWEEAVRQTSATPARPMVSGAA